jgi:fatty acid desaturase
VNAVLLGVCLSGLRLAGLDPWSWLADAVLLSFVFVQIAMLGHDVVHLQFVRAGCANTLLGLIPGQLAGGCQPRLVELQPRRASRPAERP